MKARLQVLLLPSLRVVGFFCVALCGGKTLADDDNSWSVNSAWQAHVQWLLSQQMSCQQAIDDISPCNRFVGKALQQVWGYNDFKTAKKAPADYLSANDIVGQLLVMKDKWTELGRCNDQSALDSAAFWANRGNAVLAVRADNPNGHVALVLPGKLTPSSAWGMNVPNSASFMLGLPNPNKAGIGTYVGKPLTYAFKSTEKADVKLYYRKKD